METPWGPLDTLDLDDHETCRRILAADKHQIAEGLVVEHLIDQILDEVPASASGQAAFLDIETVIIRETRGHRKGWIALVWMRSPTPGIGRYLTCLGRECRTFVLKFHDRQFLACEYRDGTLDVAGWEELTALMARLSGRRPEQFEVAASVRDATRQQQSFWGYLSQQHGPRLGERVALTRLLFNCGIQPWFRNVWNVDRVLLEGDALWHFEIKHKFPFGRRELTFGINAGELGMLEMLGRCGLRGVHSILVKPVWSKDEGSMYLLNSLEQRRRAALIALELTPDLVARMLGGQRGISAAHTTITGQSTLSWYRVPANAFRQIGSLADGAGNLARNLAGILDGRPGQGVTDEHLRSLRVSR